MASNKLIRSYIFRMRQTQASTPNQLFRSSVTTSEKARLPGIPLMIEGLRAKGTLMRQHRRFIQDAALTPLR
jgi:hypothetical protein